MLDPIIAFFVRVFSAIGRGLGMFVAWLFWPFLAAHGWYRRRSWVVRGPVLAILALLIVSYGYFIWQTQVWTNFNPNLIDNYALAQRKAPAGAELPTAEGQAKTCQRSTVVDVAADLTDFNVNQAVRRTSVELVDALGRMRGTSSINNNLQDARGNIQFDEFSWYFGLQPFGPKTPTPSYYRAAIKSLRAFNGELASCAAIFDGRADNLLEFVDRIANDLGNTASILRDRSENYNGGWFDTRADDRFWFAYGQLYGYYAILAAAQADFSQVIAERNLTPIWNDTMTQFKAALRIQPFIISNGEEDGWIMPTHLATMGFYILRVRSGLVEVRSILDR